MPLKRPGVFPILLFALWVPASVAPAYGSEGEEPTAPLAPAPLETEVRIIRLQG